LFTECENDGEQLLPLRRGQKLILRLDFVENKLDFVGLDRTTVCARILAIKRRNPSLSSAIVVEAVKSK
jgi:hypothetical protein